MGCAVSGVGVQNRWTKLKLKTTVPLQNFYAPLTSQVEELEPVEKLCNLQFYMTHPPEVRRGIRRVRFTLPQKHRYKDSTSWRQNSHRCTSLVHTKNTENSPQNRLVEQQVKQGVLEGSIPSAAWDTACKSHEGMIGDPFIQTEKMSKTIFRWKMDNPPCQSTYPN